MMRFLGFKTTGGQDMYPRQDYSITHAFEPSRLIYSSDVVDGAVVIQGVFLPDDILQQELTTD